MNIEVEQHQDAGDAETEPTQIPLRDLAIVLWHHRRRLAMIAAVGMLFALGITFLIPNEYVSTAQLMPPDQGSFSGKAMLSSMLGSLGAASLMMPDVGGGLLTGRTLGGTTLGILNSRTVQDSIINRFDLRSVYNRKLYRDTRKKLAARTTIVEDKKSGIIWISVTDNDRYRARDIAGAYIEELDKLVNDLSTSAARRERVFLEARLKSIKDDLDVSSQALSQFSSHNATMDPQKQGEATLQAAERLQGELIVARSELSGLRAIYKDDNPRVREAQSRADEMQRQLTMVAGGSGNGPGTGPNSEQVLPSARALPLLGFTYYGLYRKVTMEESLYEALTKQYEVAKVQEAEEIVPVKVLDAPELPEKSSSKHRPIFMLVGMLAFTLAGSAWILVREFWSITDNSHPAKVFVIDFLQSTWRRNRATPN